MSTASLPYAQHWVDDADRAAVDAALRSAWLTQGPQVEAFEQRLAAYTGARHAVAASSGTAALYLACRAAGVGPGDEVITTTLTFVATVHAIVMCGARPVFADVEDATLTLDPASVARAITRRTKAILTVDFAGHPSRYVELRRLARRHRLTLIADAAHALGARVGQQSVGTLADLTATSFHPVKAITTGEGGAVLTNHRRWQAPLLRLRSHGMVRSPAAARRHGPWWYEVQDLSLNFRLSEFQCALGLSQLAKLDGWLARRHALAQRYTEALQDVPGLRVPQEQPGYTSAWHLYQVRVPAGRRRQVVETLRDCGILVQVHYIPVHWQPYYRRRWQTRRGACPQAERAYAEVLALPLYPALRLEEQEVVIRQVRSTMMGASAAVGVTPTRQRTYERAAVHG